MHGPTTGCRVHTFRAKAEQQDVHEDIPDNIKQFVRRTFSTKELASQLVAPPETPLPNQHVGYINGVLHVFDESIPNDPALSEDFARARDTLIAASRQSQQRQQQQQANGLNNVTPLDNGVPIPNSSVALSAAATPVPTGSPGSSAFLTPPQLYYKVAETGQSKVTLPFGKVDAIMVVDSFSLTIAVRPGAAVGRACGSVHRLWRHVGAVRRRQLPGPGCSQPRAAKGALWPVWLAFWCHDGRHLRVCCSVANTC